MGYLFIPKDHFGDRPGKMGTDAVLNLVLQIKGAWNKGKVVSILLLDVQ